MSVAERPRPVWISLLPWLGVLLVSVAVLLGPLTFGYGAGDYYYAMVSIFAGVVIGGLSFRASADLRLIFALLGSFYFLFLLAKATIIQGPMVL